MNSVPCDRGVVSCGIWILFALFGMAAFVVTLLFLTKSHGLICVSTVEHSGVETCATSKDSLSVDDTESSLFGVFVAGEVLCFILLHIPSFCPDWAQRRTHKWCYIISYIMMAAGYVFILWFSLAAWNTDHGKGKAIHNKYFTLLIALYPVFIVFPAFYWLALQVCVPPQAAEPQDNSQN